MKISLKTEYACRVLAQLGKTYGRQELAHIEVLAEAEAIPANYLVQILNDLRNAGLIQSRRGKQGGYMLAKDPESVTLADILRAIDGELIEISQSPGGESGARVARAWSEIERALETKASSITLASLVPEEAEDMYYI